MNDGEEERLAYLATGFATGGLDGSEKQELYDLLRRPGADGARAARIAWRTMGVALDLRSSLGTQFQDTVNHRLANGGGEARDGFVPEVYTRLGIRPPHLEAVSAPEPPQRTRRSLRWPIAIAGLLLVLVAGILVHLSDAPGGRLTWSVGAVTRNGVVLAPGSALDGQPVAVSAGGMAEITIGTHGRARVRGPASIVVQPTGVAVISGEAWIGAGGGRLTVGLPDGRLALDPGAEVAVAAASGRAQVATIAGTVVLSRGNASGSPLPAGRATSAGDRTFPWHPDAPARMGDDFRLLDADPTCTVWSLRACLRPHNPEDTVIIAFATGELRLGAGWIEAERGVRQILAGPPLAERSLRLERGGDGSTRLLLEGLEPIPLHWDRAPLRIQGTALTELRWSSGPDAEPARPADW